MHLLKLQSKGLTRYFLADEGGGSSDEEFSGGEIDVQDVQTRTEDRELKDRLLHKFGSHISKLKMEFSKKKQKGKLPKEARDMLLDWWKVHYKWPYPTVRVFNKFIILQILGLIYQGFFKCDFFLIQEADKNFLAESTGLDQKQINNWFINQRKRHWKPSEEMQLAVMDSISGQFYPTDD